MNGAPDAWAEGDCAAVPDLANPGRFTGPSAQHAVRQARRLGENIVHSLRGEPLVDYKHRYAGSVASLGLHKGVAHVYGVKVTGWPAWFMHRTYHMSRVPTFNRKARVVADWTLPLLFKRDVVRWRPDAATEGVQRGGRAPGRQRPRSAPCPGFGGPQRRRFRRGGEGRCPPGGRRGRGSILSRTSLRWAGAALLR